MGATGGEEPGHTTRQSDAATGGFVSLGGGRFIRLQTDVAREPQGADSSDAERGPRPSSREGSGRRAQSHGSAGPGAGADRAETRPVGVPKRTRVATGVSDTPAQKVASVPGSASGAEGDAASRSYSSFAAGGKGQGAQTQRSRGRARVYAVPLFFLGLFVGLGVLAWTLYPRRTTVVRPTPLPIIVRLGGAQFAGQDVQAAVGVQMWVRPTNKTHVYSVHFAIVYHGTKDALRTGLWAAVDWLLPRGTVATSCTQPVGHQCSSPSSLGLSFVTGLTYPTADGDNVWSAVIDFTIKSPTLTWNANGLTVEGQLPIVQGLAFKGTQPVAGLNGDTKVTMTYVIPDAGSYDWTGGPTPIGNSSLLGTTWTEPLKALSGPIAVSGANSSAANSDTLHALLVGAFLGIGGAALVAAIQEFVHRKDRMPSTD